MALMATSASRALSVTFATATAATLRRSGPARPLCFSLALRSLSALSSAAAATPSAAAASATAVVGATRNSRPASSSMLRRVEALGSDVDAIAAQLLRPVPVPALRVEQQWREYAAAAELPIGIPAKPQLKRQTVYRKPVLSIQRALRMVRHHGLGGDHALAKAVALVSQRHAPRVVLAAQGRDQQYEQVVPHPSNVVTDAQRRTLPRMNGRIHERKAVERLRYIKKKLEGHAQVLQNHREAVRQDREKNRGLESLLKFGYRS